MKGITFRREPIRLGRNRPRHPGRPLPQILITPLIDIVFLLLIFFMLVTKFISPSIAVALPESESGTVDESRARTVSVDADGDTYLDDTLATLVEITSALADDRASGNLDTVRLRADREAHWQHVIDAIDAITSAGFFDIAIETNHAADVDDVSQDNVNRVGEVREN